MADEASTEGKPTPSRFGQGWPSRRRPAPSFVRFAVTPPSLFATPARTLPQAETGTSRHEDTNVGNQRSLFRRRDLRLPLVPACRSLPAGRWWRRREQVRDRGVVIEIGDHDAGRVVLGQHVDSLIL